MLQTTPLWIDHLYFMPNEGIFFGLASIEIVDYLKKVLSKFFLLNNNSCMSFLFSFFFQTSYILHEKQDDINIRNVLA